MPKKSGRHAGQHVRGESSASSVAASGCTPPASAKVKTNKRSHRSVHIGLSNGRRWVSLKKKLNLSTDDDLVVYLLDLADTFAQQREDNGHSNSESWKVQCREEKNIADGLESPEQEVLQELPRRSLRRHTNSDESPKNEKSDKTEKLSLSSIDGEKSEHSKSSKTSKTKRHKSKGRHHKEKRKKRKHQKMKDLKDLESTENEIKKDDPWEFASESDTEKVSSQLQDNFISQTVSQLSKDLDSLDSTNKMQALLKPSQNANQEICPNNKKTDISIDQNANGTCAQEKIDMVQNHNIKAAGVQIHVHEQSKFLESNQSIDSDSTKVSSDQKNIENAQLDQENSNKKHKRSKYETRENCNAMVELNRSYCDDTAATLHKKDKKKHKEHQVKKHRDVRKAPQDGIIVADENQDTSCSNNLISTTATATNVPDKNFHTPEANLEITGTETPRLAIKIKLCQECNSRHLQDACPLSEPSFTIRDTVTLDQWVQNHSKNSEAMKVFNSNDPISQGYSKNSDDGFESDEETSEQYKSKIKAECEEKQLTVEVNKPLFSRDSLPDCLELKLTNTDHGLGVFVKSLIPMYAQFGPLIGKPIQEMDIPDDFPMRHIWEIDINNKTSYISSTNPLTSNWIRYVRPAETKDDRNVAVVSRNGELYLVTSKSLNPGAELMYWSESQSTAWTRKNKIDKTNCGGCNLNFAHPIYYRLHCCIFHDTNYSLTIRKYHCKVCGAAVLGKDNIMKHAAQLHAGRGAYQCQYCKKFFLRLNYLEMHRTYGCSQNPQRSRPLCDFCGRKFCQPQKLKVHIKRMHSDMSEVLREFQCKLCLKLLGSRAALQRHMKEVHHKDVVGAATCDRCGKMFQNKSNLKIHMLTHSGVKPFKCKENGCKAAFTTKQCLQFHYKKVHGLTEDHMPKIERSVAYTFDAYSGGIVEDAGRGKTPKFSNEDDSINSHENSDSLNSFDDCSNENNNPLSIAEAPGNSSSGSSKQLNVNEEPIQQMSIPPALPESPAGSPESEVDLYDTTQMQSKTISTKKWISEFDPTPSSNTPPPPVNSAAELYDFQDRVTEMDVRREEDKIQSSSQNLIDETKLGIGMYRRTESSNASLLVEAALDAAEREIGAVSSPILEDSDREANLYSISNELDFKAACGQNQIVHRSPNGHLDSYMQEELATSPSATPHARHTPPGHMHLDYHIHRPVEYVNVSGVRTSHSIEQYLDQQDLQRVIHVPQDIPTSPTRYQEIPHHHHHPHSLHHHHQHHQLGGDGLSSDEGDSVAQNLSLTVKEKSLQQIELSKYDGLESDFSLINRDRVRFEPLIVQSSADQGLDMSARGLQQAFGSQNHHHHHHLYEMSERERQGVDLSRTSAACMSPPPPYPPPYPPSYPVSHVDVPRVVSLESSSRSHHLHTSVSRLIASPQPASSMTSHLGPESLDTRILSPPPPTMPSYNTTYPVGPAPYHTSRPGYHYSGYY